jgi:hypothetical protein
MTRKGQISFGERLNPADYFRPGWSPDAKSGQAAKCFFTNSLTALPSARTAAACNFA